MIARFRHFACYFDSGLRRRALRSDRCGSDLRVAAKRDIYIASWRFGLSKFPMNQLDRYSRQVRYAPIGEAGQRRLLAGRALICGCGALGA